MFEYVSALIDQDRPHISAIATSINQICIYISSISGPKRSNTIFESNRFAVFLAFDGFIVFILGRSTLWDRSKRIDNTKSVTKSVTSQSVYCILEISMQSTYSKYKQMGGTRLEYCMVLCKLFPKKDRIDYPISSLDMCIGGVCTKPDKSIQVVFICRR